MLPGKVVVGRIKVMCLSFEKKLPPLLSPSSPMCWTVSLLGPALGRPSSTSWEQLMYHIVPGCPA